MPERPLHHRAVEMDEGAGARVRRLFPVPDLRHIDPFVLLDEFFVPRGAGFPDHPHRGFEAITYLFEGGMHHHDSLGNDSTVHAGGAQVFTAGRGIVHSEGPDGDKTAHGIQLWVNLGKADKDLPPAYLQVNANQFPTQELPYGRVRTIIGPGSPIHLHTAVNYHDVKLEHEGAFHTTVPTRHRGLIYTVSGRPEVMGEVLNAGEALALAGGAVITVYAEQPCRFICLDGRPHGEPIIQRGSFVD